MKCFGHWWFDELHEENLTVRKLFGTLGWKVEVLFFFSLDFGRCGYKMGFF